MQGNGKSHRRHGLVFGGKVNDDSSPMYWGNVLEPIVEQHYAKHAGNKVRRVNAVLQHADPDKSWMLANLDYSVVNNEAVQIF